MPDEWGEFEPVAAINVLGGALAGKEPEFINAGDRHGVDPNLLMAISMFETGNGTSHMVRIKNNVGGLTEPGTSKYRTFDSVDDSIDTMARTIRRNYIDKGLTTIPQIASKYAPVGASNDPNQTNVQWPSAVKLNYQKLTAKSQDWSGFEPASPNGKEPKAEEKKPVVTDEQAATAPRATAVKPWYERAWDEVKKSDYGSALAQVDNAMQQGIRRALNLPLSREPTGQELGETAARGVKDIFEPTVDTSAAKPSRETVEKSLRTPQGDLNKIPYMTEAMQALAEIPSDIAGFMTSPGGVASLFTGGLPKVAQRLIYLGFTTQQVHDAFTAPNPVEKIKNMVFAAAGGLGLKETFKKGGEIDASKPSDAQIQTGETPLREQTRTASEVPKTSDSDKVERGTSGEAVGVRSETAQVRQEQAGITEAPTLNDILDLYDEGSDPRLQTINDLANEIEEKHGENPDVALAVQKYREDMRENIEEFGGRGDEDQIDSEFLESVKSAAKKVVPFDPYGEFVEPSAEEKARLKAESEAGLLEDLHDYQERGGDEFVQALGKFGGLPLPDSPHSAPLRGELEALREEFKKKEPGKRGRTYFGKSTGGDVHYDDVFKKDAGSLDGLATNLRQVGFDVETGDDVIELARKRFRSAKPIYGMEARGQAMNEQDAWGVGIRGPTDVGLKIFRTLQNAVDFLGGMFGRKPIGSFKPPTLNIADGGMRKPPPDSIFSPDTPPDGIPEEIYAMRITNSFKRWWEKFWPRDLSILKVAPDSPAVTAFQRLLKSDVDYLENFTKLPFWKALRGRSEAEIIDMEDKAVKSYRAFLQQELSLKGKNVDRQAAFEKALAPLPKWFQDIVRYRESRIPIEMAASRELGVDPPGYTGDPYIARLTNEEGKDVVELHPKITNRAKQIRTTIGSFDNSRVHPTMKEGIKAGAQYEPVARSVLTRELTSTRLESTANLLRELKGKVLFDSAKEALAANRRLPKPTNRISQVRGFGPKNYYARTPDEAVFLEQHLSMSEHNPLGKLQQLANTYVRNPSLINPLPHVTKNMLFKYLLARPGGAAKFIGDTVEFSKGTSPLIERFNKVMPFPETGTRIPNIMAREVGTWGERAMTRGARVNDPSTQFIFTKADPAMRYSLWKNYVKQGMGDQEAANHVWIDLVRYDANSGGMNFWKAIPFNFFVPWRTGTYVTLAKAMTTHPVRTLLFVGAVEYLREIRYRQTGRWTHLPVDYLDAPLSEAVNNITKIHDLRSARQATQATLATAATTLLFGPGGGQAPNTIKDIMSAMSGDPGQKARLMNMFWGLSQIYNLPREWKAYQTDGNPQHLVNLLTTAAISEHSALKYEPRRLMKWLPEWMPGMQKSQTVAQAEELQELVRQKRDKGLQTSEERHSVSRTFEVTPEDQQLQELERAAGLTRSTKRKKAPLAEVIERHRIRDEARQRARDRARRYEMPLSE